MSVPPRNTSLLRTVVAIAAAVVLVAAGIWVSHGGSARQATAVACCAVTIVGIGVRAVVNGIRLARGSIQPSRRVGTNGLVNVLVGLGFMLWGAGAFVSLVFLAPTSATTWFARSTVCGWLIIGAGFVVGLRARRLSEFGRATQAERTDDA